MSKRTYNLSFQDEDEEEDSWRSKGKVGHSSQGGGGGGGAGLGRNTPSSFVQMGTEQPASAGDVRARVRNKFLPLHLQEVRDEKGRKRLHGAFTGGFSAGYFNTVGSKEGWQPSQFVSSRSSRSGQSGVQSGARPEDFMDEEDLADLASTKQVAATDEFDILGGTERELARKKAASKTMEAETSAVGPLPGRLVEDLIGPPKDPVGVKLLRQMGWREGHGVGPRAKRKRTEGEEEDIHAAEHLFAPKNTTVVRLVAKSDVYGIGFNPFKDAPEFVGRKTVDGSSDGRQKKGAAQMAKKDNRGGFGVGIFEDDDDEDVYGGGAGGFGTVIDDEDDERPFAERLHGRASKPQAQPVGSMQPVQTREAQFCSDGRPPLRGFVLARTPLVISKGYPPPEVPADFIPLHKFAEDAPPPARVPAAQPGQQQPQLTADQRRDILGEEALKGPTRSVFSFLPIKEQDRLQQFIERATAQKEKKEESAAKKEGPPLVGKDVAEAALKGFMPFGNDIEKQRRYKRFLEVQAGVAIDYIDPPMHLSARDRDHEPTEFAKAAMLYRPLSTMMASRFTSSSELAPDKGGLSTADEAREHATHAAASNMYGRLTRSTVEWKPVALLCKRFNVPDPYAKKKGEKEETPTAAELAAEKDVLNRSAMEELIMERDKRFAGTEFAGVRESKAEVAPVTEMLGRDSVAGEVEGSVVEDTVDEPQRPPMDIFKAIFADSESEEESEEEEDQKPPAPSLPGMPVAIAKAVPEAKAKVTSNAPLPPPTFRPLFRRKEDRGKDLTVKSAAKVEATTVEMPSNLPSQAGEAKQPEGEGERQVIKVGSPPAFSDPQQPLGDVPSLDKPAASPTAYRPPQQPADLTQPSPTTSSLHDVRSQKRRRHDVVSDAESQGSSVTSSSSDDDSDSEREARKRKRKDSNSSRSHKKKKKKSEEKKKRKKDKKKRKKEGRESRKKKRSGGDRGSSVEEGEEEWRDRGSGDARDGYNDRRKRKRQSIDVGVGVGEGFLLPLEGSSGKVGVGRREEGEQVPIAVPSSQPLVDRVVPSKRGRASAADFM
ncbi:hypothetical protein HDV00_003863 [Rhizophlyctis rosea]|nr:hypothetical protein HDV00_003863 [Rhizophlyctis rosea]